MRVLMPVQTCGAVTPFAGVVSAVGLLDLRPVDVALERQSDRGDVGLVAVGAELYTPRESSLQVFHEGPAVLHRALAHEP
jgi:hypothetical protein